MSQLESKQASALFNQQVWCWGQDLLRPEGNWLIEVGFKRFAPPMRVTQCPSIYRLDLPQGRHVVLRGFGVFYSNEKLGGIFLPRYQFAPRYTKQAELSRKPWTKDDLPKWVRPTRSQRANVNALTHELVQWIGDYEATVRHRLGIEYRDATLQEWDDGTRAVIPAEDVVFAWQTLACLAQKGLRTTQRRLPGGDTEQSWAEGNYGRVLS